MPLFADLYSSAWPFLASCPGRMSASLRPLFFGLEHKLLKARRQFLEAAEVNTDLAGEQATFTIVPEANQMLDRADPRIRLSYFPEDRLLRRPADDFLVDAPPPKHRTHAAWPEAASCRASGSGTRQRAPARQRGSRRIPRPRCLWSHTRGRRWWGLHEACGYPDPGPPGR
jgi:hypothetical protein